MRDDYVGDVGDFGKYILLGELARSANGNLKIGINWYYNNGPNNNFADGGHTEYLQSQKYQAVAPALHAELARIVGDKKRTIRETEKSSVLPEECVCYSDPVWFPSTSRDDRRSDRKWWFEKSTKCLANVDVIFLDPDNGVPYNKPGHEQVPTINITSQKAIKYAFMHEIKEYFDLGKSVIAYNHRDHKPLAKYEKKFKDLKQYLTFQRTIYDLRFKRFSVRDYIMIPQKNHEALFEAVSVKLTTHPYDFLFEVQGL